MGVFWLAGKNLVRGNRKEQEHAHSVWFSQTRFSNLRRLGEVGQHLGRKNRCI